MAERPKYSDREAEVECYVDDQNMVKVVLPSDVWLTSDQAYRFGIALLACARWSKEAE